MFEQRERWLEELSAHVGREEVVAGSSGRMNLVAIAAELVNADADERRQKRIHVPNWESMARDLQDTTEYLGPEAYSLARDVSAALIDAIDNLFVEQLDERGQARRSIDNERRPRVKVRRMRSQHCIAAKVCSPLAFRRHCRRRSRISLPPTSRRRATSRTASSRTIRFPRTATTSSAATISRSSARRLSFPRR